MLRQDFFKLDSYYDDNFDLMLENTFFCAIDPARRIDYVRIANQILKPDGKLVGILYPINKDINDGGPPFGVDLGLTINLFSKYFTLYTKEFSTLSIERRNGQEIFVIFKKNIS